MQIILNGNPHIFLENSTAFDLISSLNIPKQGTAIAINGSIILQNDFETKIINENDRVEIIRAVGGG